MPENPYPERLLRRIPCCGTFDPMATSAAPALRASGLTKSFGDVRAVDGLSLEVRRGEIFGFLGPNGAGKTTTIKLICALLRPDSGTVSVEGRIGLSPQAVTIWENLTPLEQLAFVGAMHGLPRREARRRADALIEALGLGEKKDRLAKTLSGGMQRRLNIALALVHEPEILLLDEPQAGLDPQSRVLVREYIRALASGTTVILTTHDMEEAEKLSDRVCIIDRGKVLVQDTVPNIKASIGRGDIIELELGEDGRRKILAALPGLGAAEENVSVQGRKMAIVSASAPALLEGILRTAREDGIRPDNIRVRQITLEDVFLKLTGRGLRE
jgi:ABC-2 type transport system ATP-binding protein